MSEQLAPTPEFESKHDWIEPAHDTKSVREFWQIKTRLGQLVGRGIDMQDYLACMRWRRDWDVGIEGANPGVMKTRVDNGNGKSALDNQVDALGRLRDIVRALGDRDYLLLALCVAHDYSWAFIGTAIGYSDKAARAHAVKAIKALSGFYASLDAHK